MQRPIIFVATTDPQFEQAAMDAVFETAHGLRLVHDLSESRHTLARGTDDLALAIVDIDFDHRGLELLRTLGECAADFPVLAIASNTGDFQHDRAACDIAADYLIKPVDRNELQQTIRSLCLENGFTHEEHLLRLSGQRHALSAQLGMTTTYL